MYKNLNFNIIAAQGNLVSLEVGKEIPFDVKRVYYLWECNNKIIRGQHAHKNLEQIIFCVSGSCEFILDDGNHKNNIILNSPEKGLYLKNHIWREFTNLSSDCVIMVLASEHYSEDDYIRNYDEFLTYIKSIRN